MTKPDVDKIMDGVLTINNISGLTKLFSKIKMPERTSHTDYMKTFDISCKQVDKATENLNFGTTKINDATLKKLTAYVDAMVAVRKDVGTKQQFVESKINSLHGGAPKRRPGAGSGTGKGAAAEPDDDESRGRSRSPSASSRRSGRSRSPSTSSRRSGRDRSPAASSRRSGRDRSPAASSRRSSEKSVIPFFDTSSTRSPFADDGRPTLAYQGISKLVKDKPGGDLLMGAIDVSKKFATQRVARENRVTDMGLALVDNYVPVKQLSLLSGSDTESRLFQLRTLTLFIKWVVASANKWDIFDWATAFYFAIFIFGLQYLDFFTLFLNAPLVVIQSFGYNDNIEEACSTTSRLFDFFTKVYHTHDYDKCERLYKIRQGILLVGWPAMNTLITGLIHPNHNQLIEDVKTAFSNGEPLSGVSEFLLPHRVVTRFLRSRIIARDGAQTSLPRTIVRMFTASFGTLKDGLCYTMGIGVDCTVSSLSTVSAPGGSAPGGSAPGGSAPGGSAPAKATAAKATAEKVTAEKATASKATASKATSENKQIVKSSAQKTGSTRTAEQERRYAEAFTAFSAAQELLDALGSPSASVCDAGGASLSLVEGHSNIVSTPASDAKSKPASVAKSKQASAAKSKQATAAKSKQATAAESKPASTAESKPATAARSRSRSRSASAARSRSRSASAARSRSRSRSASVARSRSASAARSNTTSGTISGTIEPSPPPPPSGDNAGYLKTLFSKMLSKKHVKGKRRSRKGVKKNYKIQRRTRKCKKKTRKFTKKK